MNNSFYDLNEENSLVFRNNALKHGKLFLKYAINYKKQNANSSFGQNEEAQSKLIASFTLILVKFKKITMKQVYKRLKDSLTQMKIYLGKPQKIEQNIKLILDDSLVKQKIQLFLQALNIFSKYGYNKHNYLHQQLSKKISEILVLKVIKSELIKFFWRIAGNFRIQPTQNKNFSGQSLYICKKIGQLSNIGYFIDIYEDDSAQKQQSKSIYERQCTSLQSYQLEKRSLNEKQLIHSKYLQNKQFQGLFVLDLLNFIKSILKCGLSIKIQKQCLFIQDNRMKFKILKPFKVAKSIQHQNTQLPILEEVFKLQQKKGVKTSNIDKESLLHENDQHFEIINQNLKFAFEYMREKSLFFDPDLKVSPQISFKNMKINKIVDIYQALKEKKLSITGEKRQNVNNKQIRYDNQSRYQIIGQILLRQIDITIATHLRILGGEVSFGQMLVYTNFLNKKQSVIDMLYKTLFKPKENWLNQLQKMIRINSFIRYKQKMSGLLQCEKNSRFQNDFITQIKTAEVESNSSIFFSEYEPIIAHDYLLKTFALFQNSEAKYTQVDVIKIFRQFTSKIKKSLAKISTKMPLFLLRHLIMKKKILKNKIPSSLFPLLNMLNCFLDGLSINKTLRQTKFYEYYININIKKLELNISQHNNLIYSIFILSIVHKGPYLQFLQKIYQFFLFEQSSYFGIFERLVGQIYGSYEVNHPYIYFSKLSTTIIKQLIQNQVINQVLSQSLHYQKLEKQSLLEANLEEYSLLEAERMYFDNNDNEDSQQTGLGSAINYSFNARIFNLTKDIVYLKIKHYRHKQDSKTKEYQRRDCLLQLNYENMKYLSQLYQNNKRFSAIRPIIKCKSLHDDPLNPHHEYTTVVEQENLENVRYDKYLNPYFETNSLSLAVKQRSRYFYSLNKNEKINFIKHLFHIVRQAQSLQYEILNLNIFTIKISYNSQRQLYLPEFDELQLGRLYTQGQGLKKRNTKIYGKYFELIQQLKQPNKYIEKGFNIYNFPPYHWEFSNNQQQKTDFVKQHILYTQYDIGNIGLYLCMIIFSKKRYKLDNFLTITEGASPFQQAEQLSFAYFSNIYATLKENYQINEGISPQDLKQKLMNIYQQISDQFLNPPNINLSKLLKGTIDPRISKRFNLQKVEKCLENPIFSEEN